MKIAASIAAVSLWLLASVAPATASITYDYKQKWAYDSTSGLYWQVLPTPTATFVPPRGTIADDTQVNQLIVDAGITSQPFALVEPGTQAFYEPALGDLLSFFALDKPAQNPPTLRANYSASVIWDQPADYNPPLDHYQYWSFSYQPASPNVLRWTYSSSITLGPYEPDSPCPTFPISARQPSLPSSSRRPRPSRFRPDGGC
jgi:hypothetical protein